MYKTNTSNIIRKLLSCLFAFCLGVLFGVLLLGGRQTVKAADIVDKGDSLEWVSRGKKASSTNIPRYRTVAWEFTIKKGDVKKYVVVPLGISGAGSQFQITDSRIHVSATESGGYVTTTTRVEKELLEEKSGLALDTGTVSVQADAVVQIYNGSTIYGTYYLRKTEEKNACNAKLKSMGFSGIFADSGSSNYTGYTNQQISLSYYRIKVLRGTGVKTVKVNGKTATGTTTSATVWVKKGESVTISYTMETGYSFLKYQAGNREGSYTKTRTTSGSWKFTAGTNWYIKVVGKGKTTTLTLDANRGTMKVSGQSLSSKKLTMTYASTNNNNISAYTPTRTGYTFVGWFTSKTRGSGTQVYFIGGRFMESDFWTAAGKWQWTKSSSVTLYAQWGDLPSGQVKVNKLAKDSKGFSHRLNDCGIEKCNKSQKTILKSI